MKYSYRSNFLIFIYERITLQVFALREHSGARISLVVKFVQLVIIRMHGQRVEHFLVVCALKEPLLLYQEPRDCITVKHNKKQTFKRTLRSGFLMLVSNIHHVKSYMGPLLHMFNRWTYTTSFSVDVCMTKRHARSLTHKIRT